MHYSKSLIINYTKCLFIKVRLEFPFKNVSVSICVTDWPSLCISREVSTYYWWQCCLSVCICLSVSHGNLSTAPSSYCSVPSVWVGGRGYLIVDSRLSGLLSSDNGCASPSQNQLYETSLAEVSSIVVKLGISIFQYISAIAASRHQSWKYRTKL